LKVELQDFHSYLLSLSRAAAEATKDFVRTSFVEEVSQRLAEASELVDFQHCFFEGQGSRRRKVEVDGYCFDEADASFSCVGALFFNDDAIQTFGATEARKGFAALKALVEDGLSGELGFDAIEESHPVVGMLHDIRSLRSSIVRFRFFLVSDGLLNTRQSEWVEEEIAGIPVEFHIWDIVRLQRLHEATSGRDPLVVEFGEAEGGGIASLNAGVVEGEYSAYLCIIPGELLAKTFLKHGSRLLEGNVRAFLSTKGKVNSRIQETIREKPEMFFAYNNGISATAEELNFTDSSNSRIASALNLQIVNGGQTTASLAAALREGEDLTRVSVQMKLSVLPASKSGELIPLISKFANSQNKVSDADFFSNHPYHVRLEELSRRIWTPPVAGSQHGSQWFYERARGQFLNEQSGMTPAQRAQYLLTHPKAQVLTKTDVAKLENTWRGLPHKVSLGAQKNFLVFADAISKEWSANPDQFNEAYYKQLVAIAILFRHTEAMVLRQSWYQGGYRANVVTYTLAKLRHMVLTQAKGSELDLGRVWDEQSIPDALASQVRRIAQSVFKVLTHSSRPKENVTEWAKMPTCWSKVEDLDLLLDDEVLASDAVTQALRSIQPAGAGAFALSAVLAIPGSEWSAIRDWGMQNNLLTKVDSDMLRAASRIPRFAPSAKDCEKILRIKNKLVSSGYASMNLDLQRVVARPNQM
jgi:hypothetical protein